MISFFSTCIKLFSFSFLALFFVNFSIATAQKTGFNYNPSAEHPFGLPNPEAPKQIRDFDPMVGTCDCISEQRNPDGTWKDTVNMKWTFKYIMNGMALQDETLKEDGFHAGSIRIYNKDSSRWFVHYYSLLNPQAQLPAWEGTRTGDSIVLYKAQKAPNGMEGFSRLVFYNFSENGYSWKGEWVTPDESIRYPFWNIECRRKPERNKSE